MHDQQTGHLRDFFRWAGGEIWRGESETAVCACIVRLEVKGRLLFPPVALAQVHAVHPHKPVGTGNHLHHQGQLWIRQRECSTECVWSPSVLQSVLDMLTTLRGVVLVSSPSERGRGPKDTGKVVFVCCRCSCTHEPDSSKASKGFIPPLNGAPAVQQLL